MTNLTWWAYILVVAFPLGLTLVLTPVALIVAKRLAILDRPSPTKTQLSPVPYLGGAAIVIAFLIIVLGAALVRPPSSGLVDLAAFLGMAVALAVLGLIDDIRGLGPWIRLGFEVCAGVGVWATGTTAQLLVPGPLDLAATVAWVVVVTNAFNLLDNMDGLSAGVGAISAAFLFVIAMLNGQFLVASLALAMAGCALGFLRHNFHPARIYMGDAGSLFIGFVLAVISLKLRTHVVTRLSFSVPILVLGVALFDTTLVMITRVGHRRSPFRGGRDHVSHRLVALGIPIRAAVGLIYAAGSVLGCVAIISAGLDRVAGLVLLSAVLSVACALGVLLGTVPVYDREVAARDPATATSSGAVRELADPGRAAGRPFEQPRAAG